MSTREYIGARYIPVFAEDVQWDDEVTYEPLTMVQNSGETFMSRQFVPAGIQLPDISAGVESNDYWVHMSNWNAQIEQYRQEVLQYNSRISAAATDASNALSLAQTNESDIAINDGEIAMLANNTGVSASAAQGTSLATQIANEQTARTNADNAINARIDEIESPKTFAVIGDSWSTGYESTIPGSDWSLHVANSIGWSRIKKASGGTGWLSGSPTFLQQLISLNDDTAINNDDINVIVVFGGINDYNNSHTTLDNDMKNAIDAFITYFNEHFTNKTRLVICGCNTWNNWALQYSMSSAMQNYVQEKGVEFVNTCMWLKADEHWTSDPYHPNTNGYNVIKSLMECVILGNPYNLPLEIVNNSYTIPNYGAAAMALTIDRNSGFFTLQMRFTASSNVAAGTAIDFAPDNLFGGKPHEKWILTDPFYLYDVQDSATYNTGEPSIRFIYNPTASRFQVNPNRALVSGHINETYICGMFR